MKVENMTIEQLVAESQELLIDIQRHVEMAGDAKRRMDVIQAELVRRSEELSKEVERDEG